MHIRGHRSSKYLLALSAMIYSCFFISRPALAALDHLVISQVQVAGANEFVEIYNPTDSEVVMQNWSLQYKSSATSSLSALAKKNLPPVAICSGGYFLIAHAGFANSTTPDHIQSTITLANSGGTIFLVNSETLIDSATSTAVLDRLGYGDSPNNFPEGGNAPVPADGEALLRAGDTDNNMADFTIQPANPRNLLSICTATSTPGSQNDASTTPDYLTASLNVKVVRFLPNPSGEDSGQEWIELKNDDNRDVLLDGWFLDDKNTGSGPAADALVLSGLIKARETRRFALPTEVFALNNSGGDEINIYFSDKTLAQSLTYQATAYDGGIFEFRDGQWQPPTQNTSGGSSGGGGGTVYTAPAVIVKFNEVFPNPNGEDAGQEWVEIYNPNNATTTLEGYYLDDGDSDSWGSSAWPIPKNTQVPPLGFVVITLPKGTFALNNSGKERVKLFSPQKQLTDSVWYEDASEGKAWAKGEDGKWAYGLPTPGQKNIFDAPLAPVVISELLPNPIGDDEEFIELQNPDPVSSVNLQGFRLSIGDREKPFGDIVIATSSYLVLFQEDLPIKLRNTGQTIVLYDNYGRQLSKVAYSKTLPGQAYALLGKDYLWTEQASPGEANPQVLSASVQTGLTSSPAEKSESQAKEINYAKLYQENQKLNQELSERLGKMETMLAELSENNPAAVRQAPDNQPNLLTSDQSKQAQSKQKYLYLIIAGLAAVLFALLIKEIFKKSSFK